MGSSRPDIYVAWCVGDKKVTTTLQHHKELDECSSSWWRSGVEEAILPLVFLPQCSRSSKKQSRYNFCDTYKCTIVRYSFMQFNCWHDCSDLNMCRLYTEVQVSILSEGQRPKAV